MDALERDRIPLSLFTTANARSSSGVTKTIGESAIAKDIQLLLEQHFGTPDLVESALESNNSKKTTSQPDIEIIEI